MIKLTLIGYGNIARAIAHGLNHKNYEITLASPSLQRGAHSSGAEAEPDNARAVVNADIVILAVKPAKMQEVLEQIKPTLSATTIVVSVAAGLRLDWLLAHCQDRQPIIRTMPNIALSQNLGATPLIANAFTTHEQQTRVQAIFQANGIVSWVNDEEMINAFTALSGSGPAYVFLFMEAMLKAAMGLGLDEETARKFTLQTVAGAHALAAQNSESLDALRKQVTSAGGTTEAAIKVLLEGDFKALINQAMIAAFERANMLSSPHQKS